MARIGAGADWQLATSAVVTVNGTNWVAYRLLDRRHGEADVRPSIIGRQLRAQFTTLRADLDNPDSGHLFMNSAVGVCMSGFG